MAEDSNGRYTAAWQQFLVARRAMLAEYDQAVTHAREQVVAVHHGVVGEATVRHWLATFLPKRFGVTAGFIRTQAMPVPQQTAHFDVIVYDQLEAPTLWIEVNKDKSESGRARIIPAEYVRAVIEVKVAFNRRSVQDAVAKLDELTPLMADIDPPGERYPKFLPSSVVLAMVFFEIRAADALDTAPLVQLGGLALRRTFYGAVVLRGEGLPADDTAIVQQYQADAAQSALWGEGGLLSGTAMSATRECEGLHHGAMMMWTDVNFSRFAFDLLALLNGTYMPGRVSSFHGLDFSGAVGNQ